MPHATETVSAALTKINLPEEAIPFPPINPTDTSTVTTDQETTNPTVVVCDPATSDFCVVDGHFIFNRPIALSGNNKVESTYRYGSTQNDLREPHHGVEFANPFGTPVLAAADGIVVFAGSDDKAELSPWPDFYGNAVVIKHSFGEQDLFTLYGHLSKIDVATSDVIIAGTKIGEVGASGAAIGSHLHFEVRSDENKYGSTRNPELWLIPEREIGVLALRVVGKNDTLLPVTLNIQTVLPDGTLKSIAQPEAYAFIEKIPVSSDNVYGENFALGDLPAGNYRLSFVLLGKLHERLIYIESGKLTIVEITIK
jgi:murein DD-endopeptidase MepM/ murein hydrolase activator NlpD